MTKYTEDGLVTDEPSIAVLFLGEIADNFSLIGVEKDRYWLEFVISYEDGVDYAEETITIPRALVAEKIKPVEGEDIIWAPLGCLDTDGVHVISTSEVEGYTTMLGSFTSLHHRSFALVQRCGQLRELLMWCGEQK